MSKLLGTCIVCNKEGSLDTTQVKYEEKSYTVSLCTTCADDASPKQLRESLIARFDKFKVLIENAKSLGVELTIDTLIGAGTGLMVAAPKAAPVPATMPAPAPIAPAAPKEVKMVRLSDEKGEHYVPPAVYAVEHQPIPAPQSTRNMREGADVRQIMVPKKIQSNSGTLYVDYKKMSSKDFDDRFRAQAARSIHGNEDLTKLTPCSACDGQGWTREDKKPPVACKQCDGRGTTF